MSDPGSDTVAGLTGGKKVFAFAVMCVGMFIALLDIQIVSASLRDIGGGLSAGRDETAWVQTSYLIAEIIVIPLSGWLARVMSTRWLFCASAAGFTVTSLMCGWAWNIESMIAFRALQGFLGGSMIPMVFTTAFVFFQGPKVVVAAATIGAISSLAPTLGPTVGGWITDNYSWHWLFFINLLPGTFVAVVVPMMVKTDRPDIGLLRGADYPGMAVMALFLGCLEYTMEEGPRWGWLDDGTIRTTAGIALLCGIAFVWRSLAFARPVVDLRALGDRNFALGCFFSFVVGIGIFATIYLTPLFLGEVRGFSALQIGLSVFSTGVFQVIAIPVYAVLAKRVDLRWLMMAGLAGFALSMWNFAPLTHDWGWRELLLPQALRGFSQQFAVAPTVTLTLGGLAPARLKLASGLFNLMRNLGGAIGIAACGTILNDRTNLHFLRLAEHLTPTNPVVAQAMQGMGARATVMAGGDQAAGTARALRSLWALTMREAQTLTFADAFLAIGCCFMMSTPMVPLMRKAVRAAAPSSDAHCPRSSIRVRHRKCRPLRQRRDSAGLNDRLTTALDVNGLTGRPLSPNDLAPLDQFHTRGLAATMELAEAAVITAGAAVLDVGSGLGGLSRILAATTGCRVVGVDITPSFVEVATMLSALCGLADRTSYRCADALALPFTDASFDVAWSQHVAMNIADRARLYQRLYQEIHRALRPGGRFAVHDVVAGRNPRRSPSTRCLTRKGPDHSEPFASRGRAASRRSSPAGRTCLTRPDNRTDSRSRIRQQVINEAE